MQLGSHLNWAKKLSKKKNIWAKKKIPQLSIVNDVQDSSCGLDAMTL